MQVAYIRPASPVPDARFVRRARLTAEAKIRRAAINVVQIGLSWINTMTRGGKKKPFNFIDVVVRLQKKYRRSKGIGGSGASPVDNAAATNRRVARRRRRKTSSLRVAQLDDGV